MSQPIHCHPKCVYGCQEATWQDICTDFTPREDEDKDLCMKCDHYDQCHGIITTTRERLESALRDVVQDAYSGGIEFALRKPPLKHEDAQARWDLLVARAIRELTQ